MRVRAAGELGLIARQRRRDLGLSQDALAQRAGVTRQWLVRFEQGNADVSLAKAFAVLAVLDLVVRADPAGPGAVAPTFTIPSIRVSELDEATLARGREALKRLGVTDD